MTNDKMMNNMVVAELIKNEKAGKGYAVPGEDRAVFDAMLDELNKATGLNIKYLAQIDSYTIPGSGEVFDKYIDRIKSESVRAFLLPNMCIDGISDKDNRILDLYLHFKNSDEYTSLPGIPNPAHIYVRYDNMLCKSKSKKFAKKMIELIKSPRDVFYLPFTTRKIASWKFPEVKDILISYLKEDSITEENFKLTESAEFFEWANKQITIGAILDLKYYSETDVLSVIEPFVNSGDKGISLAAKKSRDYILKKI